MAFIIPTGKKLELSAEAEHLLRNQEIDENGPGTVLRDFRMLLDFAGRGDLRVTKGHLFPVRTLPEINERMTHPLVRELKRPVQKSYPHINGLYLLLRASGLTVIGSRGKSPVLQVDGDALECFSRLNAAEQYFTLLEAWLLRGWPDIIGEGRGRPYGIPRNFQEWSFVFARIPSKGAGFDKDSAAESSIRYGMGWHNLALLELFGLLSIVPGPPGESGGWGIRSIHRTAWGDAVLVLLEGSFFKDFDPFEDPQDEGDQIVVGRMQPAVRLYFPQCRNKLVITKPGFQDGVHTFKVSLGRVWLRIAISATEVLDRFADLILASVRFDYDHLYLFRYKNRFGSTEEVNHRYIDERPWATDVQIGELGLIIGQTMTFLYDFGDMWEFDIRLEKVDVDRTLEEPELIDMHGEPPRQYGGWDE